MIRFTNIERKKINRIYIISAVIIFIASMEALFLAKNKELLNNFLMLNPKLSPHSYISLVLVTYLTNILEPIIISLFTLFTINKFGLSRLYKYVFTAIIILRLFFIVLTFSFNSIFYFFLVISYVIFIYIIVSLPIISRRRKNGIQK